MKFHLSIKPQLSACRDEAGELPLSVQIWDQLSPSWQNALQAKRQEIEQIGLALTKYDQVNPHQHNIFRALGASPNDFRVVIVGQDPYPDQRFATGLAFSVPAEVKSIPPSLKNIQTEFFADIGKTLGNDLSHWADGGVLLLNRILTCSTGKSLSHNKLGWQEITNEIIKAVLSINPNTVAILWGNFAQETASLFNPKLVLASVHPSPLSAHRGFFGSKPFSKANGLLTLTQQQQIDW